MISDVLADASSEMTRYLREMPECYADCLDEVLAVRAAMDALRRKLDNPLGHWDPQSPTRCAFCGLPAQSHDALAWRLLCPRAAGGNGTTFTLKETT